jgi:hypothetical protein
MSHEADLPFIIMLYLPIQVIADLNTHTISQKPVLTEDPLFAALFAHVAPPNELKIVAWTPAVVGICASWIQIHWVRCPCSRPDLDESNNHWYRLHSLHPKEILDVFVTQYCSLWNCPVYGTCIKYTLMSPGK